MSMSSSSLSSTMDAPAEDQVTAALRLGTPEALDQRALELELDNLLSQRTDLDKQLSNLQKSAQVLDIVKADSDHILTNVRSTCDLADQVSGKVRELDLAQSRVNSTLSRIDAIVERGNCIEGVQKALETEDYESAAKYVQTFLRIDSEYKDSGSDQREQLMASKKQLEGIVRKRLAAAVDQRDHPTILRFVRLFLASKFGGRRIANQCQFCWLPHNLFKDIVLAVQENSEILRSLCGEDGIVYAICELQEECDSRGSSILKKYLDYRKLARLTSEINSYKTGSLLGLLRDPIPERLSCIWKRYCP
ncbi:Conserved oligomeric Golgi complex subunit 4 [Vitis vinifera]|uniref:Conserved oligomeric Golgi complex subunit 4 n=1 Tax=Vitis vinifera TaxID=29760 RepID=A0A438DQF4_VITVI|nr:Conserved oligomeric Golgi complex subunit 4 [Vitis vinifera]